ncbi:MAG: cytochrome b [Tatlockia sp.]|nr:cytochrome b [Tatlockia sp.]
MEGVERYSSGSKFMHWLVALLVIIMLCIGFFLGDLPEKFTDSAYMLHKSFGICILFLMLFRILWLWHTGRPSLPVTVPIWQKRLARAVQYALYFFVILMPLSGWIMSTASKYQPYFFDLFHIPFPGITPNQPLTELMQQVHNRIAWIIIALLILHIAGAIKHHFIDKDAVLLRMWPGN